MRACGKIYSTKGKIDITHMMIFKIDLKCYPTRVVAPTKAGGSSQNTIELYTIKL